MERAALQRDWRHFSQRAFTFTRTLISNVRSTGETATGESLSLWPSREDVNVSSVPKLSSYHSSAPLWSVTRTSYRSALNCSIIDYLSEFLRI